MKNLILWVAINSAAVAALSWGLDAFPEACAGLLYTAGVARVFFAAAVVVGFFVALDRWTEGGRA